MNKRNFNVVENNEIDNQESAKGIAFVKSRRVCEIRQYLME